MNATHRMIAFVQMMLMNASRFRSSNRPRERRFFRRLERIETYLIARLNR